MTDEGLLYDTAHYALKGGLVGMEDFVGCRISLWFDCGLDEVSHELVGGCRRNQLKESRCKINKDTNTQHTVDGRNPANHLGCMKPL